MSMLVAQVRSNVPRLVLSDCEVAICFGRILGAFGGHRRYVRRRVDFIVRKHPRSTPTFVSQASVKVFLPIIRKLVVNSSHLLFRFLSHFYCSSVDNCVLWAAEILVLPVFEDG